MKDHFQSWSTNELQQRPKPSKLQGWLQPARSVIHSDTQHGFHHLLVSEGSPRPGEHPWVLPGHGQVGVRPKGCIR